jgi:GNAT superfamily N-acetyltransferase
MIQIGRVSDRLPEGFRRLNEEAATGGWGHLDRLAADWAAGEPELAEGEALFAAFVGGELAGIGAVTLEPAEPGVFRMRRFYVAERFRGRGVGRALASALMQQGLARSRSLTLHALRPASRAFWEAMGFRIDERNGWTHRYGPRRRVETSAARHIRLRGRTNAGRRAAALLRSPDRATAQAFFTKESITFFSPALSKVTVSLLPSTRRTKP